MFDPTGYVSPKKRNTPLLDCIRKHGYDMKIGRWNDGTKKYKLVPYTKQPRLYSEPGENLEEFLTRLGWI